MKNKVFILILLELLILVCIAGSVHQIQSLMQNDAVPADSSMSEKIITYSLPSLLLLVSLVLVVIGRFIWKMPRRLVQVEAVLIVLLIGVEVAALLITTRQPPRHQKLETPAPLVQIEQVVKKDVQMVVRGLGTVRPKIQIEVVPEVSGKVVAIHPELVGGGFFSADETLVRIDPRDYELALQRADAAVASAQTKLDKEKAEAAVARQEWQQLRPGEEPDSPLVFREPQIREARSELVAAQAQLATAQLDLQRTEVSVPFDGRVVSEHVDLGQYLSKGQSIATVYGTELVEIPIPLEDRELAWFKVPGNPNNNQNITENLGSGVEIFADFAGSRHIWTGQVVRSEGQIDAQSRMVHVIVEVRDPFQTSSAILAPAGVEVRDPFSSSSAETPLMPGMFVEVVIKGKTLPGVCLVSRWAVHNNNQVWLVRDGCLHIQPVEIARRDRNFAYVTSGLDAGDTIIISPLDVVSDGMKIRTKLSLRELQQIIIKNLLDTFVIKIPDWFPEKSYIGSPNNDTNPLEHNDADNIKGK